MMQNAPIAQLDRVFGYEPKGRGFESLSAYQKTYCLGNTFSFFVLNLQKLNIYDTI